MLQPIEIIVSILFGSCGLGGIFIYLIKRSIDKKLDKVDKEVCETAEVKRRKALAENMLLHAQGRVLFWMHRAIVTGQHNGDLQKAWEEYENAEQQNKDIQREIIAHFDEKG